MDSPSNATTFANAQGFFPEFTSALSGGGYASNPVLAGFAKAAAYTQISPLNSKNWATADATDAIIPTMMKALMKGAPFARHGEQGEHRAAERAEHRQRVRARQRACRPGPSPPGRVTGHASGPGRRSLRHPGPPAEGTAAERMVRRRWLSSPGGAESPSGTAPRYRRLRQAAQARPVPAARPRAGRDRRWSCCGRWSRSRLYSFQNYGLPQITGAEPTQWVGLGNFTHDVRRLGVLAVAADHGAVRGRGRAADADHRHAGRPAAEPARQEDGGLRQHGRPAGLGHSPGLGQRAVLLAVQPGRRPGRLDAEQAAALAGRQHRLGRASTGPRTARSRPTRC